MSIVQESLYAADRDRAAEIARISPRQLDYWTSTGLIQASVSRRLTPHRPIKLYSFTELMAVLVAAELRHRGISLQHIRSVVEHLRSLGYPRPLHQLTFAIKGGRVYFQHPDGTWEGDELPGQRVMAEVIDLEPLRLRIREAGRRRESAAGSIERRRGTLGSKPVFAGTRVPVATIQRLLAAGHSVDDVLEAYPVLQRRDLEVAASA